jgi:hypothetical protein
MKTRITKIVAFFALCFSAYAFSANAQQQSTAQAQGIRLTVLQVAKSNDGKSANIIIEVRNITDHDSEIFAISTARIGPPQGGVFAAFDNSGTSLSDAISGMSACAVSRASLNWCLREDRNPALKQPNLLEAQGTLGLTIQLSPESGVPAKLGDLLGLTTQFAVRRGGERAQWRIISINLANIRL